MGILFAALSVLYAIGLAVFCRRAATASDPTLARLYDTCAERFPTSPFDASIRALLWRPLVDGLEGDEALEIGAEDGLFSEALFRELRVATEYSDWAVRALSKRPHCRSVARVDARALPFRPASFSRAYMFNVWYHLPSREVVLAEVGRVLRPNGRLLLNDFDLPRFRRLLPWGDWIADRIRRRHYLPAWTPLGWWHGRHDALSVDGARPIAGERVLAPGFRLFSLQYHAPFRDARGVVRRWHDRHGWVRGLFRTLHRRVFLPLVLEEAAVPPRRPIVVLMELRRP